MNRTGQLTIAFLAFLAAIGSQARADAFLPALGGTGGGQYITPCPAGQNLTGFQLRAGDDIDAIRPVCIVSTGPNTFGAPPVNANWAGGPGGGDRWLLCPPSTPVVLGLDVQGEGVHTYTVNNIHLFCGLAVPFAQSLAPQPSAIFDAPQIPRNPGVLGFVKEGCPAGQVGIGVHGTSGEWLDSVGLICGAVRITVPTPVVPLTAVAGGVAQGIKQPPVKSIGRGEQPPIVNPSPPMPICDAAGVARARNSPAALGLELQCGAWLAPQGEAIANQDPLSVELRNRTRNDDARRGFDIGMAISANNTEMGPGKQAMHDALTGIVRAAYDVAVSFSLERNRNAQLAATGAAIANNDPAAAEARKAEDDVFFWLGFDIASGIFGDPKLGALGNTATGPGSLRIRDALDPVAVRGFNAAVRFHLSRNYR